MVVKVIILPRRSSKQRTKSTINKVIKGYDTPQFLVTFYNLISGGILLCWKIEIGEPEQPEKLEQPVTTSGIRSTNTNP